MSEWGGEKKKRDGDGEPSDIHGSNDVLFRNMNTGAQSIHGIGNQLSIMSIDRLHIHFDYIHGRSMAD